MYAAEVDGRPLTFDILGVWRRNMVMQDRETNSIWQQATGEAIVGTLAGHRLEPLGGEVATWGAWKQEHPKTTAVPIQETPGVSGLRLRAVSRLVHLIAPRLMTPGLTDLAGLDPHAEIAAISLGGEERAYPLKILRANGIIRDHLSGTTITLRYAEAADRVTCQDEAGRAVPVTRQWWLGWREFHPFGSLYTASQ